MDGHILIALERGLRRKGGPVKPQRLLAIHEAAGAFPAFDPCGRPLPFRFGGVIGRIRRCPCGLDGRCALFAFEPVVLITEALAVLLRAAQVGGQVFNQLQRPDDRRPGAFVLHAGAIEIVQPRQTSPCTIDALQTVTYPCLLLDGS